MNDERPAHQAVSAAESRRRGRLTGWLEGASTPVFVAYAIVASFGAYFCMYAFRKPFAAARFDGEMFLGGEIELKSAIIISQVLGYALSKYIGIRAVSELPPRYHAAALVGLIVWGEGALFLFAQLPNDAKVIGIFLNGLSLGMVWGLVVRFLEGRVTSELLLAGLSASFIVSSGVVKDFGRALMSGRIAELWSTVPAVGQWIEARMGQVSEAWMPAITGLHFLPVFLFFVWMLVQMPVPTKRDADERHRRESMGSERRWAFWKAYWPGLVLLIAAYFLLTAFRDFRDNFAVELFEGLGYPYSGNETIISEAETWTAVGVIGFLAMLNFFRHPRRGLIATFSVMTAGTLLLGAATLALQLGWISGFAWMVLIGLGSYLAYVPYGSLLFERLMASSGVVGTAVFAIYVADAVGYTGAVGILLFKDIWAADVARLDFFRSFTWLMSAGGAACLIWSAWVFLRTDRALGDSSDVNGP